ncbi:eukaryotic translation initiation factor 2D [Copidosoma floridanum]|uniref:eukaryotic translation initiation factor 2D n=1 Tax=Copidosoma floridanum TaxID=29053 RepID=UPI0006C95733|nr:eukaryotic translation initiation factor 2D [Copidosoma floridanum]
MFVKAFKIKSNNQLKGTERKKLCDMVAQVFPVLKHEEILCLLPKKEAVSVLKIIAHNGQTVKIFCTAKIPVFFQLNSLELLPTVFTLWQHPHLLYTFVTQSSVVSKLTNGANLLLPGVITDKPPNFHSYGNLKKGHPVALVTDDNKAPVAVGITTLSSEDMYMCSGFGKCVEILHVVGDTLFNIEKSLTRPQLGPPMTSKHESESVTTVTNIVYAQQSSSDPNKETSESCTKVHESRERNNDASCVLAPNLSEKNLSLQYLGSEDIEDIIENPAREMDKLLEYCFLKACKISLKKGDLPMITSTFFKIHVITACPVKKTVDVKKSSYKKLSVFLAKMKEKGVIDTSVIKGVESLLSVKIDHPLLKSLVIMEDISKEEELSNAPVISECFRVTAAVVPLLTQFGYEKGDILKRAELRRCFMDYVKSENLQDGKILKINPLLANILRTKENQYSITMEDGINKFIGKMTYTHEITVADTKILHSGKLAPIEITVATRCSNKKVTLINNLETFGIKLEDFAKDCQGIGASTTITDVPGKKTPSVLVQGNQVLYVYKLLIEKYRIQKNYVKGLEFAPKKRK